MTRSLAVCLVLLLAACSRHARNPEVEAAVAAFDQELEQIDRWRGTLSEAVANGHATARRDFRGRTIDDDVERWILPAPTRREIKALRDRAAAAAYPADAQQLLEQALRHARNDAARGKQIGAYWNAHLPAPYWRSYWHDLYASNGMTDETPDSMLVSIESRVSRSLDSGDFEEAGKGADELNAVFGEAVSHATNRIFKTRAAPVTLAPRRTPCAGGRVSPQGEKARLVRGDSLDAFYPSDAIKRGESGSVVLRALVDSQGCARSVAIQVHSGVPALDAAALTWFETASFAPGSAHGKPIDSMLVWKVRFELRAD